MKWTIEYSEKAIREAIKIDKNQLKRIFTYLENRVATEEDPRRFGKLLTGKYSGLWRYRIGDFRVIARIHDEKILIYVIYIGHRKNVYGGH